jgi:ribosome-binding protein aMBF1 (putative translation factor)
MKSANAAAPTAAHLGLVGSAVRRPAKTPPSTLQAGGADQSAKQQTQSVVEPVSFLRPRSRGEVTTTEDVPEMFLRKFEDDRMRLAEESVRMTREVGEKIYALRKQAKISQADLAKEACIQQANLSRVENGAGVQGPSFVTVMRIARALGMELTWVAKQE